MNNNRKKDRLDRVEELLEMTMLQTAENSKQLGETRKEFNRQLKQSRAQHDREMKEIRSLFKEMIKRIAV